VQVAAPLALDAGAAVVGVAAVEAAVETIQDAIEVFPVAGRLEALRLCVRQHKAAGPAVGEDAAVAVVSHSLDIAVLALEERPEEDLAFGGLAYAVEGHVRVVEEVDHYEDCR
jgi:hypothetical protein